jgi:hypothetical protein
VSRLWEVLVTFLLISAMTALWLSLFVTFVILGATVLSGR